MSQNSKDFSKRPQDVDTKPDRRGGNFRRVLVWSFDRGTLQYDIICVLILAFIFLVPRSCFIPKHDLGQLRIPAANGAPGMLSDGNRSDSPDLHP